MDKISTPQSQNVQREGEGMSSAVTVQRAARGMVRREAERFSDSEGNAIVRVARNLRMAPGSFGNVVRMRVKRLSADARDRIVAACIADLSREIQRLEHEKQLLMAMGVSPRADDMDEVEAALATARRAIEKMKGNAA